jgi:hypothetical protein
MPQGEIAEVGTPAHDTPRAQGALTTGAGGGRLRGIWSASAASKGSGTAQVSVHIAMTEGTIVKSAATFTK